MILQFKCKKCKTRKRGECGGRETGYYFATGQGIESLGMETYQRNNR